MLIGFIAKMILYFVLYRSVMDYDTSNLLANKELK